MRFLMLWMLVAPLPNEAVAPGPGDFHMTVQDVFAVTGRGVVVTGFVEGAPLRVNDVVCLRPAEGTTRELTVAGIEMFRRTLDVAEPGQAVGVMFEGIEEADVKQGDALTASCD
jgi:elongation factor Tu